MTTLLLPTRFVYAKITNATYETASTAAKSHGPCASGLDVLDSAPSVYIVFPWSLTGPPLLQKTHPLKPHPVNSILASDVCFDVVGEI
jgi:hypothetical protein